MKSADPHAFSNFADKRFDPLTHLTGCFVGKRDRQNAHRVSALADQMRHAVRQHAGLARTCARNHQ